MRHGIDYDGVDIHNLSPGTHIIVQREGDEREPPGNCLTREADAEHLRALLRLRIKTTAADGTLLAHRDLRFLLYSWLDLTGDDGATVRSWTASVFASDDGVRQFAKAFTSYGRTHGLGFAEMGDVVAKRVTQVSPESMAGLMDLGAFWSTVGRSKRTVFADFLP